MIEQENVKSDLPELDRADDPGGKAVAWALLVASGALIASIVLATMWATGVW